MRGFPSTIFLIIILVIALIAVSFALVMGIALGVGWVLTRFLPFSLFEATLVGMITALVTWIIWRNILGPAPDLGYRKAEEEEEAEADYDEIPLSRFCKTDADKTWENLFRYEIANTVYEDFLDSPGRIAHMNERQLQELSIRLTDAAIAALKVKSPRTKRLRVTKGMLKHEMIKMGQQPYDDDILDTAVSAINDELISSQEELIEVIRDKLWDEPL
ncbi:MAG: hypothetical protein FJ014_14370 [Chloroflexi bacterium]|nr:hypothetical protein [Chloroflexota bacterium]